MTNKQGAMMKSIFMKLSILLTMSMSTLFSNDLTTMLVETKNNPKIIEAIETDNTFSDYYKNYSTPLSITVATNHPKYINKIYKYINDLQKPFGGYSNSLNYLINAVEDEKILASVIEEAFNNEKLELNKTEFDGKSLLFYLVDKGYKLLLKKAITFKGTDLKKKLGEEGLLEYDSKRTAEHVEILLEHFKGKRNAIIKNIIENKTIPAERRNHLLSLLIKDTIVAGVGINPAELLKDVWAGVSNTDIRNLSVIWFADSLSTMELLNIKNRELLVNVLKHKKTPTKKDFHKILADIKLYHPSLDFDTEKNSYWKAPTGGFEKFIKKKLSFVDKLKLSSMVDLKDKEGETPVLLAVKSDLTDTSEYLLDQLPDLNVKDSACGRNVLHHAVLNGNKKLVSKILDLNVNIYEKDCIGFSPLEMAIAKDDPSIVKMVAEKIDFGSVKHQINGYSLLIYSIKNNLHTLSKILLNYTNADVDEKDSLYGHNALVYSVMQEDGDLTLPILKKTKKTTFRNINNNNILDYVVNYENTALLDMLLKNKTDFNRTLSSGLEPIFVLIRNKSPILKRVLEAGSINLELKDPLYHKTPLWWTVRHGNFDAFKEIVSKGRLYEDKEKEGSVIRRVLAELKLFKHVVSAGLYDKNVQIEGKDLTIFIIDNYPYLFKHVMDLSGFTPEDKKKIFKHAVEENNIPLVKLMFKNGFMTDRRFVKNLLMDMADTDMKWLLEKEFNFFFYMNNKGEVPLIEYFKKYDEGKLLHIIKNVKKVELDIKDLKGDTVFKHLHKIKNAGLLKYFFVKMTFKQKEELLKYRYGEQLITQLVNESSYKSDIRLLFSYALKHGYSNLTKVILGKQVIQDKDIMASVKEHYNEDLIKYTLSSKLLDTKSKTLSFILDIEDPKSFRFAVEESKILSRLDKAEKASFLQTLIDREKFYEQMKFLLQDGKLLDIKDEMFFMIVANEKERGKWMKRFLGELKGYKEPEGMNTLAMAIIAKDTKAVQLLIDSGFDIAKEDKKGNTPLALMFKYLPDETIMGQIMRKTPLDVNVGSYRLVDLVIQKKYFKLFEIFLESSKYKHLVDASALVDILKSQESRFFDLMVEHRYDFSKNEIVYEAMNFSGEYTLKKILTERIKVEIGEMEAKLNGRVIKINPLEYFLMFRKTKNEEMEILKMLGDRYSIESDVPKKFNEILNKNLKLDTLKLAMKQVTNKEAFIRENELLRMALKNDASYNVFLYLKSNVDFEDEEYLYERKPITGLNIPMAITLNRNIVIHEQLKRFDMGEMGSEIFKGLIETDSLQITEWLIRQGLNPDENIINLATSKGNTTSQVVLRAEEIDPFWKDGVRHVKKNKIPYIILILLVLLAAMGYRQLKKYLEDRKFEKEAAKIVQYKVDPSWGTEEICAEIRKIQKELHNEEPTQDDFENFNYYKYYLDLHKRKEHAEKSEWVKSENMQELIEELHGGEHMILSDDELTRLLGEIGDGTTKEDAVLMDDDSELDLEELEYDSFRRDEVDDETMQKIRDLGENPEEMDDETLHMLIDSLSFESEPDEPDSPEEESEEKK